MTAGTLISLRTWSTESIAVVPHFGKPAPQAPAKNTNSVRPLRDLLIACQKLVSVGRPGNREQRQNRNNGQCSHAARVGSDCGQKRQSLAHFQDEPGILSWPQSPLPPGHEHRGRSSPRSPRRQQKRFRDGQAERLGSLEIDDQIKLDRHLHRQIGRGPRLYVGLNTPADRCRPGSSAVGYKQ